nr:P-type conjugative transfer protein TrbG [Sphingobium sp. B11D3B]
MAEPASARQRVGRANDAARVQPDHAGYQNAIQQYPWAEGALFQIYTAPGQITDIVLQEGEQLVGPGPVAAGDTVRWIIGDTVSGSGAARRVHILVKPTRADIATNLVINTDRRTYHLELHATAATYMAAISWTYPQDALIALRAAEAERDRVAPLASGLDVTSLDFRYRLGGDRPDWRPMRIFDDGRQVFIEFAEGVARSDMPPLFVIGESGEAELVNYRVAGRYMIVDRLFATAELRLVSGRRAVRVSIERLAARGKRQS